MIDLKNYICSVPFTNMEIHDKDNFMCCPSWLLKRLPSEVPLSELWNSEEAKEIRKSVSDGSYRHCDKTQCPYLTQTINFNGEGYIGPIFKEKELPGYIKNNFDPITGEMKIGPKIIQMSFDRTCNYKCPSCRIDLYVADGAKIKKVKSTIAEIEETFGKDLKMIYVTGSGDPFVSVGFRNFLRNFDETKFPSLDSIHLHTNASKWNREMWDTMKPIHKYVKSCEISIDAGAKNTYENITRLGGEWDVLIDNLMYINTLPNIAYVKPSFVVQSTNYEEMLPFLKLMKSIFGTKAHVFFGKINNWGTFTDDEFKDLQIWDKSHPDHDNFVREFNKVALDPQCFHNLQEFIKIDKTLF